MAKPTDVTRWASVSPSTTRDEPSSGEKDTGWIADEVPTHGIMNWLIGTLGDWATWLNVRLFDAYTLASLGNPDCRLYGDDITGLAVKKASGAYTAVSCSDVIASVSMDAPMVLGTTYSLKANRDSTIVVPLASGLTNEFSGAKWFRSSGSGPNNDILVSLAAGAQVAFLVQVPYGAKVTAIVADWQPSSAGSGTKMCMKAHQLISLFGADGADVSTEYDSDMLSTAKKEAAASTNRKWAVLVPDQNNTGNTNDVSSVQYVRIEVIASSEASGDKLWGLYLVCEHKSVGHLGLAPTVT
jgi:hypothetical protein